MKTIKLFCLSHLIFSLSYTISTVSVARAYSICSPQVVTFNDGQFKTGILKYPSQDSDKRSIILMPPTGGTNLIDRSYASTLCERGFDVYILEQWTGGSEYNELDLLIHEKHYHLAQKAIGLTIENIRSSRFIGILGTSAGGIHASIAMSLH